MARKPRIHVSGGFYHVMLRGNNGQDIFFTPRDRQQLNDIVIEGIKRYHYKVHAYCWMTNHIHLLIQVGETHLSKVVQHLATRYAKYFNRMRRTVGHVFQGRFKSILVESDTYLLTLVRYIHQNPIRASQVARLEDYRWSSHQTYLGIQKDIFVTTQDVMTQLASRSGNVMAKYCELMEIELGSVEGLESGVKGESRVLGSDDFVGKYTSAIKNDVLAPYSLDDVIDGTLAYFGLNLQDICSPSQKRDFTLARSIICYHANAKLGITLKRLSELFGRNDSALCKSILRYREKYPELFEMEIWKA